MLVDVGVKFFTGLLKFADQLEKEINDWMAEHRELMVLNIQYQVTNEHLLAFVTYGKEKE